MLSRPPAAESKMYRKIPVKEGRGERGEGEGRGGMKEGRGERGGVREGRGEGRGGMKKGRGERGEG